MYNEKNKDKLYEELKSLLSGNYNYDVIGVEKITQILCNWFSSDELADFIEYLGDEL